MAVAKQSRLFFPALVLGLLSVPACCLSPLSPRLREQSSVSNEVGGGRGVGGEGGDVAPPNPSPPAVPAVGKIQALQAEGEGSQESPEGLRLKRWEAGLQNPAEANPGAEAEKSWGCRDWLARGTECTYGGCCQLVELSWEDYQRFYSWSGMCQLGLGLAVAAPLANTHADNWVHNWYQQSMRTPRTDQVAQYAKMGGEWTYAVPLFVGVSLAGWAFDDTTPGSTALEWGTRSLRAMMVGAPPLGLLQIGLGAPRPMTGDSNWRPFYSSHGASGHAFVGAVPFLTAAEMTDNPLLRYPLVLGSFAAGWSRINDDAHYLSQVMLGWWLAYLAVHSVDETETDRSLVITPSVVGDGPGVSVLLQY